MNKNGATEEKKINGLKYVEEQTKEIILKVLKENGMELQYAKIQNEEIVFAAIKQNGIALQFAKFSNERVEEEAIRQNKVALKFAKETKKTIVEETFGTYGANLTLYKYKNDHLIQAGCWFGDLKKRYGNNLNLDLKIKMKPK